MSNWTAVGDGFTVSLSYPDSGWYVAPSVIPALRSPHELFALSNRTLEKIPSTSEANQPLIQDLDAGSYFIWGYYEVLGDPVIGDPARPPIPDYSRFRYPFAYRDSEVFPAQSAYDWDASKFLWRRVGLNLAPSAARPQRAAFTVMIWEGTSTAAADVRAAEAIVASVSVSQ
jgi:hypothetical protein